MVALKAREVDRFLANPDFSAYRVILIYGPDGGMVSERADQLATASGVDLSDPFSLIRINADDAASDPLRLVDETGTIGMFGGTRLVRISGNTRRDLAKAVKPVLENPPEDAIVVIEAGDLKKSAGLRKLVEANAAGLAIPCYQDNDTALQNLIQSEIIDAGLSIDRETRTMLTSYLGADRKISRNELQKLALFAHEKSQISLEDIQSVVSDASALVLDDVVDGTASGNLPQLEAVLPRALESGSAPDMILRAALVYFQSLHALKLQHGESAGAKQLFRSMRPPMHFSREQAFMTAAANWTPERLAKATARLDRAMFECRANAAAARSIAGMALLALALEARALGRRRNPA